MSKDSEDFAAQRVAMRLSLLIGIGMFLAKGLAYLLTSSAAILSDAAESVVHVAAVGFAAWGLALAQRPPDRDHPYGHEKVSYFSAGVEGSLIAVAAIFIVYEAIRKIIVGPEIENIGAGTAIVAAATVVNSLLGWYLIRTGRLRRSLILVANGKHVLTDGITSLGVLVALALVALTGWTILDPILAIVVALHILRSGAELMRVSIDGLMDRIDPEIDGKLRPVVEAWAERSGGAFHALRHRRGGHVIWVDVHLLFPRDASIEQAHAEATVVEEELAAALPDHTVEVTSHLEPLELHAQHHPRGRLSAPVTPIGPRGRVRTLRRNDCGPARDGTPTMERPCTE